MRLKRVAVGLAMVVGAASSSGAVEAGAGNNVNAGGEGGTVHVEATANGVITQGSGGASVCDWEWLTYGQIAGIVPSLGIVLPPEEAAEHNEITIGGVLYRIYHVSCPGFTGLKLVNASITPADLIPGVRDYAERTIELPEPIVNPPVTPGGVVNLGMWLAVEEAAYQPITARAGLAWITVTPQIGTTTFSFGNGDEVTCDGFGVPITDLDTVEEGPCGYTFRRPGDYTMTITSTWNLPYTSSAGSGALAPMDRTTTVTYHVKEIQTVGASG